MQKLMVWTDPPGAACTVAQGGAMVAVVASTPAAVHVSRDLCRGGPFFCPVPEKLPPLEIVCEKDGYLVSRTTLPAAWAYESAVEDPTVQTASEGDGTSIALSLAGRAAVGAAIYFPPVGIPIGIAAVAGSAAYADANPSLSYAYHGLPEILLVPAAFESPSARETFFAAYKTKLEAVRDARVARIDAQCRYWPCAPSGPACVNPVCERQRARVNAELKTELARLPELRAMVQIGAP